MIIDTGARPPEPKPEKLPAVTASTKKPRTAAAPAPVPETAGPLKLTVHKSVPQGSEEWHALRRGIVTASVVGLLVTSTLKVADNDTSRGLTRHLAAERITGFTDPTYTSPDMERGKFDEPIARGLYSEQHAPATEVGFMVGEFDGFTIGYSPDGLVGDDGLIEIKSRAQKTQLKTVLDNAIPAANMAQLQSGLLVSGRAWIDYVSYCGGMPLWVRRVYPDPRWRAVLVEAVAKFELTATEMISDYMEATAGLPPTERIDYWGDGEIH